MPLPNQTLFQALVTEQTCGDACWHAKEEICHCSCGGRNHGCLRSQNGEQPARTRRIKDAMYQLVAVESYKPNACIAETSHPMYELLRHLDHAAIDAKLFEYYELMGCKSNCDKPLPGYLKSSTESELNRWTELSQWHNNATELELIRHKPLCLWVRSDLLHLVPNK
jgi:hypothetical protein